MFACKTCHVLKSVEEYRFRRKGYRVGKCRECERAYQREWYVRDPEKIRRRKRESMARKRANDVEAARKYQRDDYANNREARVLVMREYTRRRFFWTKATKLRGPNKATAKQIARLWKDQRGLCALTGRRLDRTAQLDHRIPLARGGGGQISNLQWLCAEVNLAKRDLTNEEFAALCRDVMAWIGERIAVGEAILAAKAPT